MLDIHPVIEVKAQHDVAYSFCCNDKLYQREGDGVFMCRACDKPCEWGTRPEEVTMRGKGYSPCHEAAVNYEGGVFSCVVCGDPVTNFQVRADG